MRATAAARPRLAECGSKFLRTNTFTFDNLYKLQDVAFVFEVQRQGAVENQIIWGVVVAFLSGLLERRCEGKNGERRQNYRV